jgi:P4 family phage/plasmid primase-like protien
MNPELKKLAGWLLHKNKVPCTLDGTSTGWQNTRYTYEEVCKAYDPKKHTGLGIQPTRENRLVIIDYDNCIENEVLTGIAKACQHASYMEKSPSGRGVHQFFWGSCKSSKIKGFEIFGDSGFVTVTGEAINNCEIKPLPADFIFQAPGKKAKVENPLEKGGTIGAFCKAFDIHTAIEKFIPGIYTRVASDRYHLNGSKSLPGVIVYDNDLILFSNHATDIVCGRACNAFDLVRIHKSLTVDEMLRFCSSLPEINLTPWYKKLDNGKIIFMPDVLANELANTGDFINYNDIWYYYKKGVFNIVNETFIQGIIRKKLRSPRLKDMNEVLAQLKILSLETELEFNEHEDLIIFNNVALKNFKPVDFSKKFRHTVRIPVEYDANATCPTWENFIKEVVPLDAALLQEMMGHLLTLSLKTKSFYLFYGPTDAGKSVVGEVIKTILSRKLLSGASLSNICDPSNRWAVGEMYNKVLNINTDISKRPLKDTGALKQMTGDGFLSYEKKRKDSFMGKVTARLLFFANDLPALRDRNEAFFNRLKIINFPNRCEKNAQDIYLAEKLKKEIPGIINWCLEGLKRLQRNGYKHTENTALLEQYKKDSNNIIQFVEDCCEISVVKKETIGDLYDRYKTYCIDCSIHPFSKRTWVQGLIEAYPGIDKVRINKARYFRGIKFVSF